MYERHTCSISYILTDLTTLTFYKKLTVSILRCKVIKSYHSHIVRESCCVASNNIFLHQRLDWQCCLISLATMEWAREGRGVIDSWQQFAVQVLASILRRWCSNRRPTVVCWTRSVWRDARCWLILPGKRWRRNISWEGFQVRDINIVMCLFCRPTQPRQENVYRPVVTLSE